MSELFPDQLAYFKLFDGLPVRVVQFKALGEAGGVEFTWDQRTRLLQAMVWIEMHEIDVPSGEKKRQLAAGLKGGKMFLEFLDFFIRIQRREQVGANLSGKERVLHENEPSETSLVAIRSVLAELLAEVRELKQYWRGKPGPSTACYRAFLSSAARICREAGATGPYYGDGKRGYSGSVLDMIQNLHDQIGYPYASRNALGKAILNSLQNS